MSDRNIYKQNQYMSSGIDFRDLIELSENFSAEDFLIKQISFVDCWIPFATGSFVSFKEKVIFSKTFFFEDCVFLNCIFYKDIVFDNCHFRGSLSFVSCLFFGEFCLRDSTASKIMKFNDNIFKSNVTILNNHLEDGTDILAYQGEPYENTFEKHPKIKLGEDNTGYNK